MCNVIRTDISDLLAVSGDKGDTCVNCFSSTNAIPGPPGPQGQPGFPGNATEFYFPEGTSYS